MSSEDSKDVVNTGIPSLAVESLEIDNDCVKAGNSSAEFQNEEVDMNDPNMDGLEWATRKILPIPRAYYWETENYQVPIKIKAWHLTIRALGVSLNVAERVGGFFANAAGLNSSRYDYVTSTMTEEQWDIAKQNAAEQRARRQAHLEQKTVGGV